MKKIFFISILFAFFSCKKSEDFSLQNYHSFDSKQEQYSGGIKMIPIKTPKGTFNVWTKRFGNNPKIKVLLLHG